MQKWEMLKVELSHGLLNWWPKGMVDLAWLANRYDEEVSDRETILFNKDDKAHAAFSELIISLGKDGWEPVAYDAEWDKSYLFKRPIED